MDEEFKQNINDLAKQIRKQAHDLKVDTFLSFLYTSDIIDKYLDIQLSDQPITRAGFSVLHIIILNDGMMIPTEISKKIWRSKHSVTKVIDTLEKLGLVKRVLDINGNDRRVRRISITRKGLNLVKKASAGSRERISQQLFRDLDESRLAEFNKTLKQLRKDTVVLIKNSQQVT